VELLGLRRTFRDHRRSWILSLPQARDAPAPAPVGREEADATIAAVKPPKRTRPLIAIIGINDATETTDYLMPYGILRRADVADVVALATGSGPKQLLPPIESPKPARVLGETLRAIAARYGAHTADFRCHAARIPKGNAIRRLLIGEGQGSGSNRMKRLDETMPCARAHVAARSRMTKAVASVAA
jgi:hypothetical protein